MPQQDGGVHRLKDILTEEVSLVDRAANKRRFLLVKRDGEMAELKPNGRGGFTRVSKAEAPGEEEDTEKAKGKGAFPGAAPPFGKKPAPAPPGEKPAAKAADDEGEDDEATKAKAAKAADDEEKRKAAEKADMSGAALASQLEDHLDAMTDIVGEMAEMEDEEPSDVHMKKAMAAHKGMGDALEKCMTKRAAKAKPEATEKSVGASEMRKAVATLQALLASLMDSPSKMKDHEPEAGDPQVPAKGWSASNPSMVPSGAAGTAGGVTKQMVDVVDELKTIVKSQAAQIAKLEKGIVGSNATPVERSSRVAKGAEVSWPLDMAREMDPSTLKKNESFLDD